MYCSLCVKHKNGTETVIIFRLHLWDECSFVLLLFFAHISEEMNPQTDKVVRRTTMVATAVASYFLLTGDYGPEPNVLDPVSFIFSFNFKN